MSAISHGSTAAVVAAIREDAASEVERIEKATAAEIARLRANAAAADVSIADRELQLARARRANAERNAQEEWDSRRAILEQREEWMSRVVARGRELLAGCDTDALVREAVRALPPGEHRIEIAPGGGVVVTCGHVAFDNSFPARARRLEPEWRKALSEVYRV